MKFQIIFLILGLTLCVKEKINRRQALVEKINRMNTTWKAKYYGDDFKRFYGVDLTLKPKNVKTKVYSKKISDLPKAFDLRKKYPDCETLFEIRDQANCGGCWAFAAAEVMSDRLCIKSQGQIQTRVSTQNIISCCPFCGFGCHGGNPIFAFQYWKSYGIPSGGLYGDKKTCQPYVLPECDDHPHKCTDYKDTPECEEECQPGFPKTLEEDKTYGTGPYIIIGEENMMNEILENGSISATFFVYEDFNEYESGIYQYVEGHFLGGHAIKIIGWGEENGVKYWICANSWNPRWGESGYFRVRRGTNECGIEMAGSASLPK